MGLTTRRVCYWSVFRSLLVPVEAWRFTYPLRAIHFRKLLSHRQKKTRLSRVFSRWKHHDFAKTPTTPISEHHANSHWHSVLVCPPAHNFSCNDPLPGSNAFCSCRWNSPSVNSRWHCYVSGGDKLPCSRIKIYLDGNVIHHSNISISC